jgi:hypothetical protein
VLKWQVPKSAPAIFVGGDRAAGFVPTDGRRTMYFTDRGIEELVERRGEEEVSLLWLGARLREFVDLNPEFETPVERLATWLARLDDDEDDL